MRDTAVAIATTSTTALATTFILIACVVILVVISILLATSYYAYCTHTCHVMYSNYFINLIIINKLHTFSMCHKLVLFMGTLILIILYDPLSKISVHTLGRTFYYSPTLQIAARPLNPHPSICLDLPTLPCVLDE